MQLASTHPGTQGIGAHSRDETGQDPFTRQPFRKSRWSLPPVGSQWGHPSNPDPTDPTGETYLDLTHSTYAQDPQSVQSVPSVQMVMSEPTENEGEPTDDAPDCSTCGRPISTLRKWAGKTDCVTCEQTAS